MESDVPAQRADAAIIPAAWRDYLRRYRPHRWWLAAAALLSVAQSLLLMPAALLIKLTFDRILAQDGFLSLLVPGVGIVVLAACSSSAALASRHIALRVTKPVIADLRKELSAKAYVLAGTFSVAANRAAEHSVIVQDTERLDAGTNAIFTVCLPAVITAVIFLVAMGVMAPLLLLPVLVFGPLAYLSTRLLGRRLKNLIKHFRRTFDAFDNNTTASLRRIELARLRAAEDHEAARQAAHVEALLAASTRVAWAGTAYSSLQGFYVSVITTVTLVCGGTAVAMGLLSIGGLAAFSYVLMQLGQAARALHAAVPQVLTGIDSLANISAMLAATRLTPAGGAKEHAVGGAIAFRDVAFSYDRRSIFEGLDLEVPPGGMVAIVGPNGTGKTTLLYLLLGIYEPERGDVLVDGVPVRDLAFDRYRRQVGVVLQDSLIFAGTIFENIAYGLDAADPSRVERAAVIAGADGFIRDLPGGYATRIGQDGVALSGGQSQMLSIARAILREPKILVLDEPTNHLDGAAVKSLLDSLAALPQQPTILIVTHDAALAAVADTVYTLESGRLVASRGAAFRLRAAGGGA